MNCYICEANDWHWRTDLNPQKEVGICKNCGNVAFKIEEGEEEKIKKFYRSEYRGRPGVGNLITTNHKLNCIKLFLADWLKDKKGLTVADIGAATGYLLNWFRLLGHKVTGTELTLSFRRFSEHYYGIPLTEELETKHKYDLIVFYHTLEHFVKPDEKLKHHISLLSENGVLMVSVPEWLNTLENLAGLGNMTIDNYFHKNHINCFTRQSAKNLFARMGLKIVKEEYETLGQTYLLEKCEPYEIIKENWEKINEDIDKIKKAIDLFNQKKFQDAIGVWHNFPDAHLAFIFDFIRKDPERQQYEFNKILETSLANKTKIITAYAVWLYQNERNEEAIKYFEKAINTSPSEELFIYLGWCLTRLGKFKDAMHCFNTAMQMNPEKWTECTNWICHCASQMLSWDERAVMEMKEQLFKQANPGVKLKEVLVGEKNQ